MKRTALTLATLIACKVGIGQLVVSENKFLGIAAFNLGDSISKYEPNLKAITVYGVDTIQSKTYQSTAALKKPVDVTSISFKHVSFEFDNMNKVTWINFSKPYVTEKEFATSSRQDYNKLISYVISVLGREGEQKVYYPRIHEGRQWLIGDTILLADLQDTGVANSTSVGITVFSKSRTSANSSFRQ